ncbi:MAG: ArdC family protein [Thermoanaerobaculia bacterium]|nr:ArdC family protein [Thermoanaerobaculia bacterium]
MTDRTDKLEAIAARFLNAFRSKQLPKQLARLFFAEPSDEIPCHRWSVRNRFITLIEGHDDARGFRQWQEVGRFVKKGEHAFFILSPIVPSAKRRKEEAEARGFTLPADDDPPRRPAGFRYTAVFGYHQTDGAPIAEYEERCRKVETLPLVEVARSWGLEVRALSGTREAGYLGRYQRGEFIAVGVENPAVWAHELVHAAEDQLGRLKTNPTPADETESEVVAELGGEILLEALGRSEDVDLGFCYRYLVHCCDGPGDVLAVCDRLLKRTLAAVTHILDTSDQLAAGRSAAA